jgi:catechol 2,3-dioxygenase
MTDDAPAPPLPPDTSLGRVGLRVRDLARSLEFFAGVLGLDERSVANGAATLGPPGGEALLRLVADPGAKYRSPGTRGLYHVALLLPDRASLAAALARLANAHHPLQGFADHAVSEAIYLADPDGNGLELYADRPRETWRRAGGSITMTTQPLDVRGLLALQDEADPAVMPAATRVGHLHLQVSDLGTAEAFYHGTLGFDVTNRGFPGALFLSAGGYHHHIGLNTWGRSAAPPPDTAGLIEFEMRIPDAGARLALGRRLAAAGTVQEAPASPRTADPDGNIVVLVG